MLKKWKWVSADRIEFMIAGHYKAGFSCDGAEFPDDELHFPTLS